MLGKGTHRTEYVFQQQRRYSNLGERGVRIRALNVDSLAAWIDNGICLDIADSTVDVEI